MAKFGSPDWKPISETWHASIKTVYQVKCYNCDSRSVILETADLELAKLAAERHDATHSKTMAGCCMHSGFAVCDCGNVLV